MEVLLIFLTVFVTLVASLCTALIAPLRQLRSRVNPSYFKRVKIPYPVSMLFVGIGGKRSKQGDVSKYGVIVPMLLLQILGYLLTVFIWALVPVLYYRAGIDLDVLFVIPLAVAVFDVLMVVLTEVFCVMYGNRKQQEESYEEQPVEEPVMPVAPVKKAPVVEEQPAEESPVEEEPIVEEVVEAEQPVEEPQVEQVEEPTVEEPAIEEVAEQPQPVEEQPAVEETPAVEVQEQPVEDTAFEQSTEQPAEEPTEDKKDND